jgi:hypothetical protein
MTAPDDERAAQALEVVWGQVGRGRGAEIADIVQCLGAGFEGLAAVCSPWPGLVCDEG